MKRTAFFGLFVALLLAVGCGGVSDDTRLSELSESDRDSVCDGVPATVEDECGEGVTISMDFSNCPEFLGELEGEDCAATVGDLDTCSQDACSEACEAILACALAASQ